MWLGFAVKHVGRKVAIGTGVIAAAILSTESGRKLAKVVSKGVQAGSEAAIKEIKAQQQTKIVDSPRGNR